MSIKFYNSFFVADAEFVINAQPLNRYYYLLPGFLVALIIFLFILIVYFLYKYFKKINVEKELLVRAEVVKEYEQRKKEEFKKVKKEQLNKKEYEQGKNFGIEQYLKEEEKQVVNILRAREGVCEQGTLRIITGMPKSTLSRILSELEARNIVYKEKRGKKNIVFLRK
ncbi:MAG: hypothetical protein QXG86_03255 [Candidatus Woesearchaeota archaeon]